MHFTDTSIFPTLSDKQKIEFLNDQMNLLNPINELDIDFGLVEKALINEGKDLHYLVLTSSEKLTERHFKLLTSCPNIKQFFFSFNSDTPQKILIEISRKIAAIFKECEFLNLEHLSLPFVDKFLLLEILSSKSCKNLTYLTVKGCDKVFVDDDIAKAISKLEKLTYLCFKECVNEGTPSSLSAYVYPNISHLQFKNSNNINRNSFPKLIKS